MINKRKLFKRLLIILITIFLFCGIGLTVYILQLTYCLKMPDFYNIPEIKLWAHAQNNIEIASKSKHKYPGLELDLVYLAEKNSFIVRHDVDDTSSQIYIEDYLTAVSDEKVFFWFDLKNLTDINAQNMSIALNNILDRFNIKKNSIVESQYPDALYFFSERGIHTSYWIPHFTFDKMSYYTRLRLAMEIGRKIKKNKITALSCRFDKVDFLNEFFPKANIHIWTSDNKGGASYKEIENFKKMKNIKIILVDEKLD